MILHMVITFLRPKQYTCVNMIRILLTQSVFSVPTPYCCISPCKTEMTGVRLKVSWLKNNTTFKLKYVKVLVESSVIKVTAYRNGNICIEGIRIRYLILVRVSQSEITRTMCICLLQDQTLSEFTLDNNAVQCYNNLWFPSIPSSIDYFADFHKRFYYFVVEVQEHSSNNISEFL